jgi:hypothetical protein
MAKRKKIQEIEINPSPFIFAMLVLVVSILLLSKAVLSDKSPTACSVWSTIALILSCSSMSAIIFYIGFVVGRTLDLMIRARKDNNLWKDFEIEIVHGAGKGKSGRIKSNNANSIKIEEGVENGKDK